jgi:hypothetical protein
MGKKKRMLINDHAVMGQELKIARDALQKAVVLAYRTHGKTKELSGMLSMVLDGLLRVLVQADNVFFKENPDWQYSPYYGELFERRTTAARPVGPWRGKSHCRIFLERR